MMKFFHHLCIASLLFATACTKRQGDAPPPPVDVGEPPVVPTAAEARAVIEKAIAAHGGEAAITKLRTMRIKAEGSAEAVPGQPRLPFVIEDLWQMPDRYKTTNHVSFKGKDFIQTQVIDGAKGWIETNGIAKDMPKDALAEMKEQKYGEDFDRLGFLKDPNIALSLIADDQVNGAPATGVKIASKGHRDVTLYFDKKTNLLVKRAHPILDPATGAETLQVVTFGDHELKDGVMHYRTITAYRDGKPFVEAKVTEIEFLPKIDEKVFAKP